MKDESIKITGGRRLTGGAIQISGSANQVTKGIIASLLTDEDVTLKGVPNVTERTSVEFLYQALGGKVQQLEDGVVRLNSKTVDQWIIDEDICKKNRISILAAGPLLHRFKKAQIHAVLGGDQIGKRPVNFHIKALEKFGAIVELRGNAYHLTIPESGLQGAHIRLDYPSVMTTESILITATLANGRTIIDNAAIEPEVFELVKMLQKMGADIMLNTNRQYVIHGVKKLKGCELRCMIDRNEAVSFATAALATGGDVLLKNVEHNAVFSFINYIQRMGAQFKVSSEGLYVKAPRDKKLMGSHIEVDVHPGFMTDWQQPFMVLFTQSEGVSVLHETVFENRLHYCELLQQMGASIKLTTSCLGETSCRFRGKNHIHSAIVQGPTKLHAKNFALPPDIRAGKCLVIAALCAEGKTELTNIHELKRKYDRLVEKLQIMGADIE